MAASGERERKREKMSAALEADLAAMRSRLAKLRSAREVLAEYHGPRGLVPSRTKRANYWRSTPNAPPRPAIPSARIRAPNRPRLFMSQ